MRRTGPSVRKPSTLFPKLQSTVAVTSIQKHVRDKQCQLAGHSRGSRPLRDAHTDPEYNKQRLAREARARHVHLRWHRWHVLPETVPAQHAAHAEGAGHVLRPCRERRHWPTAADGAARADSGRGPGRARAALRAHSCQCSGPGAYCCQRAQGTVETGSKRQVRSVPRAQLYENPITFGYPLPLIRKYCECKGETLVFCRYQNTLGYTTRS